MLSLADQTVESQRDLAKRSEGEGSSVPHLFLFWQRRDRILRRGFARGYSAIPSSIT
jgi:hypothetical protein